MTTNEVLDMIVSNWGFENEDTIEAFNMADRGETAETILEYKARIESGWANDNFGFDL